MEHYQFKLQPLGHEHLVEIRIVMPHPNAVPADCHGPEARKLIAKWMLSSVVGLAASCGVYLQSTLRAVFSTISEAVDAEVWRTRVFDLIRQAPISPRALEDNPPEGLGAQETRIIAQSLLDEGLVMLDENLKLTVRIN